MKKEKQNPKVTRPPIVTILGHVDHGKTTLLDFIRKTNVAKREAGGITQGTGASVAQTKEGKKITFIDTPGHAAFAKMRSRGAQVADIAVLVVAGEEGVKPQTEEALNFILDAKIPFIVAVTKVDLPTASADKVRTQMEKLGVSFEGRGGDVPLVKVSGRTGEGVDSLLDLIILTSEIHGLEGKPEDNLEAVVIETGKDKKGPTVSCVIRSGKIKVGQDVVTDTTKARIRGIFDSKGKSVEEVFPGKPALLLGFGKLPFVGSKVWAACDKENIVVSTKDKKAALSSEGKVQIILKASSMGCIEAIIANLPQDVTVIDSGVGDVTESDVFLAKSTNSRIFAFEVKTGSSVKKLAETEDVGIETFDIVYELFEKLEELIDKGTVKVKGKAKIVATFPYNKKNVAGCNILSGKITKADRLVLTRGEEKLGEVKVISMKKGKQDIQEAKQGEECGIIFTPELDFKVSDVLLSYNSFK